MAGGSETATLEGYGVGRVTPSGTVKWRGSHFYITSSTGRLTVLDNVVGVFEAEIDTNGDTTEKIWEWKQVLDRLLDPLTVSLHNEYRLWKEI